MLWRALRHTNVLRLVGVTITEDLLVAVSEWMAGGTIMQYVEAKPEANRLGLVRFPFKASHYPSLTVRRSP